MGASLSVVSAYIHRTITESLWNTRGNRLVWDRVGIFPLCYSQQQVRVAPFSLHDDPSYLQEPTCILMVPLLWRCQSCRNSSGMAWTPDEGKTLS